jgi:hypothetical protein
MPALPAVPNVIRLQLLWTVANDADVSTTLYFQYTGDSPDGSACAGIAEAAYSSLAGLNYLWIDQVTLTGIRCTDLSASDSGDAVHAAATVGTNSDAFVSAAQALLVNYTINRRYRGGKPRSYFPFGGQGDMSTPDAWSSGFVNSCQTGLEDFFSTVQGTVVDGTTVSNHCNVSYYSGFTVVTPAGKRAKNVSTLRVTPLVNTVVTLDVSPRLASQRRRIPRA